MSSGTSSGSSLGTRSSRSSEEDVNLLAAQMENRRKRRKESNRESARRSRLRKQQHLDDLNTQVNQLTEQNKQLDAALRVTSQSLVAVQAHNSVLQTQKMELDSRLASLAEILLYLNSRSASAVGNTATPGTIMNMTTGIATPTPSDVTWSQQPVDLYYQCF